MMARAGETRQGCLLTWPLPSIHSTLVIGPELVPMRALATQDPSPALPMEPDFKGTCLIGLWVSSGHQERMEEGVWSSVNTKFSFESGRPSA